MKSKINLNFTIRLINKILYLLRINNYNLKFLFRKKNKKNILINKDELINQLHSFSPDNGSSSLRTNYFQPKSSEFDLQIIIPVYNVEKYLKDCIDSIVSQGIPCNYIITLINDGSTDNSGEILKQYENNPHCEIINQENRGFSGARNTGLNNIKGNFIMFMDSDDMLPKDSIKILWEKQKSTNADIIYGGYATIDTKNNIIKKIPPDPNNPRGYAWGKLFRSNLFSKHIFPENYWFEDAITKTCIVPLADKVYFVKESVYFYRINPAGITRSFKNSLKTIDTYYISEQLLNDIQTYRNLTQYDYDIFLNQIIFNRARINTLKKEEISKIIFYLTCDLIDRFKDFKTTRKDLKLLEWSLRNRNFKAYLFS